MVNKKSIKVSPRLYMLAYRLSKRPRYEWERELKKARVTKKEAKLVMGEAQRIIQRAEARFNAPETTQEIETRTPAIKPPKKPKKEPASVVTPIRTELDKAKIKEWRELLDKYEQELVAIDAQYRSGVFLVPAVVLHDLRIRVRNLRIKLGIKIDE